MTVPFFLPGGGFLIRRPLLSLSVVFADFREVEFKLFLHLGLLQVLLWGGRLLLLLATIVAHLTEKKQRRNDTVRAPIRFISSIRLIESQGKRKQYRGQG